MQDSISDVSLSNRRSYIMEDDVPIAPDLNRRHSFGGGLWKRLRRSTRKPKAESFVSYSHQNDPRESFISRPTNFQIMDIDRRDLFVERISIQECPFDVTGYGNLIMKEKFKLRRPKRKKIVVFLFEQIIIFTTAKKGEELYYYFGSIKIANLSLAPHDHNTTKIIVRDFVNSKLSKHQIEYKLEAASPEIQNSWRDALERCLWQQLVRAKDNIQNG